MPTPSRKYSLVGTLLEACSCASPCPCRVSAPEHGMVWEFTDRNALQGELHFEA